MVLSEIGTQLFLRLIPRIFLIAYLLNGRATTWGNGGKFELAFYYAYPKWARKVERGPESRWGEIIGPGPPYVLEQFYFPLGKRKSEEFGTGT